MKLLHFLGFHTPLTCVEPGEIKYDFQSPFDIIITKYLQYKCECGREFWMPRMSFEEWRMDEFIYKY